MENQSFFSKLFDMSFSRFVTPSIIQVIFVLGIVAGGIAAIGMFTTLSFAAGAGGALLGIVVAAISFLVYVVLARMSLEALVALFRIAENTKVLADAAREARRAELRGGPQQ